MTITENRVRCFATLPASYSDYSPIDATHITAAMLAFDAQSIEGIGGLDVPTDEQLSDLITSAKRLEAQAAEVTRLVVWRCRESGMSWTDIGDRFDISRQAAQQRFGR
jgi:hypothetical protein